MKHEEYSESLEKIFEIVQENTLKFSKLISFLGNKKSSLSRDEWIPLFSDIRILGYLGYWFFFAKKDVSFEHFRVFSWTISKIFSRLTASRIYPKMFSTDYIFRQQENLVDNQKCQAGFRPLCKKILFPYNIFCFVLS